MRMATATATAKNARAARRRSAPKSARLTTYDWVALDKRGKRMKGDMPAKNASLVKAELRRQGMNPQTVRETFQAAVRRHRQHGQAAATSPSSAARSPP